MGKIIRSYEEVTEKIEEIKQQILYGKHRNMWDDKMLHGWLKCLTWMITNEEDPWVAVLKKERAKKNATNRKKEKVRVRQNTEGESRTK